MQRSALTLLRSLGSRLRVTPDETVLRVPKFARELNPDALQEEQDSYPIQAPENAQDEQDDFPRGVGARLHEESPGTSYDLPHLRANVVQQRYPVSALHALVQLFREPKQHTLVKRSTSRQHLAGCRNNISTYAWYHSSPHHGEVEIYIEGISSDICPWLVQKQRGLLNLEPEYQRGFVWDKASSSRLVETILLGLPVPEVSNLQLLLWESVTSICCFQTTQISCRYRV